MIPLRLQVRNFLSYRGDVPPLLFDGFKLACLSGLNGHGKSALLDAMTWVLWGKARTRNDDELVHLGCTDMEVQFDFQVGPNVYRVLRKRTFHGGRSGRSTLLLDFQVRDGEQFRSIAGDSRGQTEQEIVRRLHLDYDTFVNSAFILQGQADSFTTKPPSERKRILGELLGLWKYDDLETRSRDRTRALEGEVREIEGQITDMERQISERPALEARRDATEVEATVAEADLRAADAELERLKTQCTALEQKSSLLADLRQRTERTHRRLVEDERRLADLAAQIARNERLAAARAETERLLHERDTVRTRLAELERLKDQRTTLESQAQALRLTIERASRALAEQRATRAERVRTLRREADQRAACAAELENAERRLAELAATEEARERLRDRITVHQARHEHLSGENKRLNEDAQTLKQKRALLLPAEAICPTCSGPLTPEQRTAVLAQIETELDQRRTAYRQSADEIKRLATQIEADQRTLIATERGLNDLAQHRERLGGLRDRLAQAERATAELPEAEASLAEVERQLSEGAYAADARAQVKSLEAHLTALAYEAEEHQTIRDRLAELADIDRRWAALEQAAVGLVRDRAEHEALSVQLAERQREAQQDNALIESMAGEIAALPAARRDVQQQSARCQDLATRHRNLRDRLAGDSQMLDHLTRIAQTLDARRSEAQRLKEERSLFSELTEAFGKRGVQAMLIDQVLPDLADETNRLLARLTEGQMWVSFETQRAARSGDNTIETLDIRIGDEAGVRPYELFSGGEAFRVNFAIRIALSKLLARRAGAEVRMLVVDEGFGTQDERGCERLVEAINVVSDDFAKVLVITHVERLKDVFPVRIEVSKTHDAGSQFVVV